MKRLAILALILILGAAKAMAQPADVWDEQYEHPYPLGFFKIKDYDQQRSWMENPNPRFNIYFMPIGIMFQGQRSEPTMLLDLGVRTSRHFYAGVETGVNFATGKTVAVGTPDYLGTYVPLALNIKGLLPSGKRLCPYISASAGGYFGIQSLEGTNGLYGSLRAGIEYNRVNLTAGYSLIKLPTELAGGFQFHFGFRFGR